MEIFDPCAKQHGRTTAASEGCPHRSVLLAAMIDRHARPIKPGFWQLSAGGVSVNLDEDQMARYKASGRFWYDEAGGRVVFDTGYPRLDRVLGKIYEEHGFLGPDDAERGGSTHVLPSASPSSGA
jgi:hypothetical protein